MKLTRKMLKARRLELEQQKSGALADLHAIDGALQQVNWSFEQLDRIEEEVIPEGVASDSS